MNFVRKVANSDILANILDIPESLRNKQVEILIFPYEDGNTEGSRNQMTKNVRGVLQKYKNTELQNMENGAWAKTVIDEYENS